MNSLSFRRLFLGRVIAAVFAATLSAFAASIPLGSDASLAPFPPDGGKSLGAGVILVPDGANADGLKLTRWLNARGIVVFVAQAHTAADVTRAVHTVRERAKEFSVAPQRIALLGVGRGAELAGEAVFNAAADASADDRPNFLALIGHVPVPAGSPPNIPTFLAGSANEGGGKSTTLDLWNKLRGARVSVDVHASAQAEPPADVWPEQFYVWARFQGLMTDEPRVPIKGMVYLDGQVLPHGYVILTPVDSVATGPIVARVLNSTANEAIGSFAVRADQGPIAGRYRADVRQNMNRWLSNSFSGALVGGRGGATAEQAYFGHHRVLAPSIDDQKSFTKVRPTDKEDYIIEIKPDAAANQDLKLEVFSGAPLKPAVTAKPEDNVGGIVGGPKNPGQAAYVAQILNAPAGPVPGMPEPVLLWPNGAPEAVADANGVFTDEDKPALYCFPAAGATNTRAAFLVMPGGAFTNRCMDNEGVQIAKFLNRHGMGGFVLRYRIGPNYPRRTISTMDAQRAMRYLRAHAKEFGIDPDKLGIIGFSAGAELEGDAFYNAPTDGDPAATDPIDRLSAKANFSALIYGGRNPQKPAEAPPTFLFNTVEDGGHLVVENAVLNALRQANVPVEAHFYYVGPHGTAMSPGDPQLGQWPELMIGWMKRGGWLK